METSLRPVILLSEEHHQKWAVPLVHQQSCSLKMKIHQLLSSPSTFSLLSLHSSLLSPSLIPWPAANLSGRTRTSLFACVCVHCLLLTVWLMSPQNDFINKNSYFKCESHNSQFSVVQNEWLIIHVQLSPYRRLYVVCCDYLTILTLLFWKVSLYLASFLSAGA